MTITVAAIGKIIYKRMNGASWNFPHFHLVSYREDEGYYTHCIELNSHAWADTLEESIKAMVSTNDGILDKLIKGSDEKGFFDYLKRNNTGTENDDLWESYRLKEISLAQSAKDIGSKTLKELRNKILADFAGGTHIIRKLDIKGEEAA